MSKSKNTRSSVNKDDKKVEKKVATVAALRKVFYIEESLLNEIDELRIERFYHPGKGSSTLFITRSDNKQILEVIEFSEPRRSWLINSDVCSNGKIYMTTPIDVAFLALHYIRKHCSQKAMALDSIHDEKDASASRLLTTFVKEEHLICIADKKEAGDMTFFKYNHEKSLAWLALKTKRVAEALKKIGVHCGHNSISQNYAKSDKVTEEKIDDMDYLRMACDIVGTYIDYDLHEELIKYMSIPSEIQALSENKANQKRKSLQSLNAKDNKKMKMEGEEGVTDKLKNGGLLDDSMEEVTSPTQNKTVPLKEKTLTAKEKALAKGAKGTKSIASFFTKK